MTTSEGTRIQSVARASRLLLWIAAQPDGASAAEIASSQGLTLPTSYHLVNTLAEEGLLSRDSRRRYALGDGAAVLAQAYMRQRSASERLRGALRTLADRTEETVYLADWGDGDIRVLDVIEGRHMLRVAEVGSAPYEHGHARANGKVLLAYAPDQLCQHYLVRHPLSAVTPNTITDSAKFAQELRKVRKRGYAVDNEEFAAGVSCLAAPLLAEGQIVASFGLSVPTDRFRKTRTALTRVLLEVVRDLSDGM